MKYYVYIHKIKNTDTIFYIGSNWQGGNPNRAYERIKRPNKWIDEVVKRNGEYDIKIIAYFDTAKEAYNHEMKLMAQYQDDFNWCWCNGERKTNELKAKIRKSSLSRKIIATKNHENTVYDSIRYASQLLNIKRPTIHHYLKTGKRHSTGYCFKYFD
ncbi:hypothetical protein V7054_14785 [Priestia megaterium]|uniref:hypothetical protein n=1 Tax=Priestia megaterium TaxID=1404 RepID=UPI00300070DB